MRKRNLCVAVVLLLLMSWAWYGCSGKKKDFDRLLVELAGKDATIDASDWQRILDFLDGEKRSMGEFYADGVPDEEKIRDYISDFFQHRRPPMEIAFSGIGVQRALRVNFYLERSGSMVPYDAPSGDGSFKAAIVQMLNNLPGGDESNSIFVVNNEINPYPKGYSQFVADSDIFGATKGIGDASHTDFAAIFRQLLDKTGRNELSILVTDMIYSTEAMTGVNAQKVFAEAQGMINSVFKSQVKDKAMLIVKMQGSYNGPYYSFNSTEGKMYQGRRPYYIVVVGNNETMARLTRDADYQTFCRWQELRGYENMWLMETANMYEPYYSLLLSNKDIRGRFAPERSKGDAIHGAEGLEPDRHSGDIKLALAVDLGGMLIDKNYLTDIKNYVVSSDDKIELKEIREVSKEDDMPAERKYLGKATHIFVLQTDKVTHEQTLRIALRNVIPAWVERSSTDDDTNLSAANFAETTFGLKYLLQGIYNSYRKHSDGEPCYFELKIKLED